MEKELAKLARERKRIFTTDEYLPILISSRGNSFESEAVLVDE